MTADDLPPLIRIRLHPRPLWARVLLVLGAILCFAAGILGWLIPVVTGIPFYLAGIVLLGMVDPAVVRWANRTEAKLSPKWRKRLRRGLRRVPIRKVRENIQPGA